MLVPDAVYAEEKAESCVGAGAELNYPILSLASDTKGIIKDVVRYYI